MLANAQILDRLSRGTATALELCAATGLTQPALSRRLVSLRGQVLPLGAARARRYGLLQRIRDLEPRIPVYQVNDQGHHSTYGAVYSLAAGEFWFKGESAGRQATGLFPGLPWFLQDLRPQGFLGRLFPRQHVELDLPTDVRDWNDGMVLYALARRGDDAPGGLILGDVSFTRWWERSRGTLLTLQADERERRYPELAQQVMRGRDPGSSAAGEQPKFVGMINSGESMRQVIVKFSPMITESVGRRWADLLIAEFWALATLRRFGLGAAESALLFAGDRVFLEVSRFDRVGPHGRRSVMTLTSVDAEFVGLGTHWPAITRELVHQRRLSREDAERVERLYVFGQLIANSDMHNGNLSLLHESYGHFCLAPIYDMLPMRYAPIAGEVATPDFAPPPPIGDISEAYLAMRGIAWEFWQHVADDGRVSDGFRRVAGQNARQIA